MKIAILTSGILPVPAVQGGAVENLTDYYLAYNDQHQLHDITVYSVADRAARQHPALRSTVNYYHFIDVSSFRAKVCKRLFYWLHHKDCHYHYTIEYFLHQALKDIRRQRYDVIILENRPAYALQLSSATKARLVYHLHNEKLTPQTAHYQTIYNAADLILTVSDYIRSQVEQPVPAQSKTLTVHNGIDLKAFSLETEPIPRKQLGLTDQDFLMVFSGRITPEKGIMQLIEAMLRLKHQPHIKLLVIGSSFYGNISEEDAFVKTLKEKAAPLSDRIIFTGFIPYQRMPQYLRMADVAVIPSVWDDPFPTTVLEAQAVGLPIITTRRGGIPEEVNEEGACLLTTGEHFVDHLTAAIDDLFHHPDKRRTMSKAARQHALLFSKERYARDFFDAINTL